ncbi:LacI family transcriptional regulator [Kribbella sp. NBC_01245]|uniref:LacI family DNA-binding transcriptional regulator n=1 Tax=Kribbella sp. NBC_01245 TaxID=2903578 RepID=UPI002E2C2615|nr:LacI family DNA-binding transcriptional regulator [Kribbella sp. NBC_01245]
MQNRPARSARVTITDVGAAAGVSPATVSRVLNGTARVDSSLALRVQQAVAELGYRPNAAAQGLARGQWETIGVLVPDLANPYFPDVLKAVSAVARSHGRRMLVMESDEDPSVEHDLVEDLMRCCDGVLLCSPRMTRAELAELAARDHPMVLFNRVVPGLSVPSISVDFHGGMTAICGHLAQLGHRRAVYLAGPPASWANAERIRAFSGAKAFGLEVTVVPCGSTSQAGYDEVAGVLGEGVTAIVTYNDLVAFGALMRLRELGVDVPGEVSVTGFDDISLDRVAHSNLTTVSVPRDQLGRQAGEMLELLLTEGYDAEPRYLPMELRVRDTTGSSVR